MYGNESMVEQIFKSSQYNQLLKQRNELLENLKRIIDRIEENEITRYFPSAYNRAKEAIKKAEQ